MKKILIILYLSLSILSVHAQQISFSDSAVISLLTCSPGEEVYATFGHTAIRINDSKNGKDLVFNYGLFSFETNNFYLKFINGQTDYLLGVYETAYFLPEYKERNSTVWEQKLNLSTSEKRKLINSLSVNYLPENRTYRYNFIYDNCAIRPRDKIVLALDGFIHYEVSKEPKTFRQWIGDYTGNDTWLKFGIDLIFGIEADRLAGQTESMFLPEILMTEFELATVIYSKNESRKLVTDKKILINRNDKISETSPILKFLKPFSIAIFLLAIGSLITLWDTKRRRHLKWFDSVLFVASGLAGLFVLYMMFFSLHPLVKFNLNLLWLNPLNIFIGGLIWIKSVGLRKFIFYYQILNIVLYILAFIVFALSIQSINIACFPIIVLLIVRTTSWFAYTKRKLYKRSNTN